MAEHLSRHPIYGELEAPNINIIFEGKSLKARKGQTVAAALLANQVKKLGVSRKLNQSRGVYCNDGRCYSCYMTINGKEHIQACNTIVEEGMEIITRKQDPDVRGL